MLDLMQQHSATFISVAVFIGLLFGSFLNVVIHRVPKMMERDWADQAEMYSGKEPEPRERYNLLTPRSCCPSCGHQITAIENIPVISYLLLRGKCSGCKAKISPRYPLIELLTGILSGVIAWKFGFGWHAVAAFGFMAALVALTFIDLDTFLLPDDITLPLMWAGVVISMTPHGFTDLQSSVIGAIGGYMSLWLIYWAFRLLTGKEGIGYGDFKLLAAIGAWFGWILLPQVILMSSVGGAMVGVFLMVFRNHGRNNPIPFGPYLAMGGLAVLLAGNAISFY